MKLISGTFENGCGVIVSHEGNYYHLVVVKDCIEIKGKKFYKEDLSWKVGKM